MKLEYILDMKEGEIKNFTFFRIPIPESFCLTGRVDMKFPVKFIIYLYSKIFYYLFLINGHVNKLIDVCWD